jgi:hypothetical protein
MRSLLAVILCLCGFLQSTKQQTSNKQDEHPQTNKSTINQSVLDSVKSPETQFYTYDNQKSEGNETAKDISDVFLALFTFALVVVSIMQWRVLRKHEEWMRKHDAKLGQLAEAADKNADAAKALAEETSKSAEMQAQAIFLQYRPRIIVRFAKAYDFNVAELGKPATGKISLNIVNIGGTPARVVGGSMAIWTAEGPRTQHSTKVEIHQGKDAAVEEFTLEPGEQKKWESTLDAAVTNSIRWANYHEGLATEPTMAVFLIGTIRYRDELNIPRQTGINRKYDAKTGWFTPQESEGEYTD